jgi:iron complex outermembrane receptor protein
VNVIDGLIAEQPLERRLSGRAYAGYTSVDEGATVAGRGAVSEGGFTGVLTASHREANDIRIPGFAESAALRAQEEAEGEAHDGAPEETLENSFADHDSVALGISYANDRGFAGVAVRSLETNYGLVGAHEEEAAPGAGEEEESPFIGLKQIRVDARAGAEVDLGPFNRILGSVSGVDYEHTEFEAPGVRGTQFANDGYEARVELDNGAEGERWAGSVGIQASRRDFAAQGVEAFVPPTVTEQHGVFAFQTFESGAWGVEGGLRYDHVSLDNDSLGETTFDIVNASAGVHGDLTDNLLLGLSVSRTERAPTDVELFSDGPHLATQQFEVGDPDIETEKGVQVEATARWNAGPLKLSGSVYRFDFDGFIYLDPTGEEEFDLPVFQVLQDDAAFTGAELALELDMGTALQAAWSLDASADIVRAELSGGEDVPRIPPASASLGLEGEAGRFTGRLEVHWADDQNRVADFELPTEGWTTVDLRLTTAITDSVDFIIEGLNLTDEEVRLHASPLKDLAPRPGRGFRAALLARF